MQLNMQICLIQSAHFPRALKKTEINNEICSKIFCNHFYNIHIFFLFIDNTLVTTADRNIDKTFID